MQNNIKGPLKIATAFLGCVIGAGFASGQEILIYFVKYKQEGIFGIFISVCIFLFLLIFLNLFLLKYGLSDFKQFINKIINNKISKMFYSIFFVFAFVTYGVMASGFAAAIKQHTSVVNNYFGFILYIIIMSIVLFFNQKGLIYINLILTPILILGILVLSIFAVLNMSKSVFFMNIINTNAPFWIISAALYTGYNSITGIAVVCELGNFIYNKRTAVLSAVLSAFVFGLILVVMYVLLNSNFVKITEYEIPMLYIASVLNNHVGRIYFIMLLMAMLTTGAGCGHVICQGINLRRKLSIIIINLAIIPFIFFDFASLIQNLYGLFGVFGIILIFIILFKTIIKERNI